MIGDVGGTNVRLQLVKLDLKTRTSTVIKALTKIPSQSIQSFEEAVASFLSVSEILFVLNKSNIFDDVGIRGRWTLMAKGWCRWNCW